MKPQEFIVTCPRCETKYRFLLLLETLTSDAHKTEDIFCFCSDATKMRFNMYINCAEKRIMYTQWVLIWRTQKS